MAVTKKSLISNSSKKSTKKSSTKASGPVAAAKLKTAAMLVGSNKGKLHTGSNKLQTTRFA